MEQRVHVERRRHRRYIADGLVEFHTSKGNGSGSLVNISLIGLLLHGNNLPQDTDGIRLCVQVNGYPIALEALGEVVWSDNERIAVRFLSPPDGIGTLLDWFDRENYSWTGVVSCNAPKNEAAEWKAVRRHPRSGASEQDDTSEDLFRLA